MFVMPVESIRKIELVIRLALPQLDFQLPVTVIEGSDRELELAGPIAWVLDDQHVMPLGNCAESESAIGTGDAVHRVLAEIVGP
jgi:hypothetical protein